MTELSQEEKRRRLRAARVLRDVSFADLAARIAPENRLSERTLRKIESGEERIREAHLRTIAPALGLPYEWFTVCDLGAALIADEIEARLASVEEALQALNADREPA